MFCTDIPNPTFLFFSSSVPNLLYYSHIPSVVISLLLGLFVYFKNRSIVSKILFSMTMSFSLWVLFSLLSWTNNDVNLIMFIWSFFGLLTILIYILGLYFVYVYIDKKDISFVKKIVFLGLLLPVFIFGGTEFNLGTFNLVDCGPLEGAVFNNYYYLASFALFMWMIGLVISRYRRAEEVEKKPIIYLGIGMGFFLALFFVTGYISSLLYDLGYTSTFEIEQYGLFGMTFFMGVLAFMIVKFKAFNIKLLGAQALVFAQFAMIGAMFFFASSLTNQILIGVTLLGTAVMGVYLIRSVKAEVQRKEELQLMSDKLAGANDQLRKLDNSKSEFISIASHQLRTPITAVKGFVSLLLEGSYGKITAKQEDALNKAYASNERLLLLVEDLLNVSRIESGRMEFKLVPTNVVNICQEVADTLSMKARERKLYLNWEAPGEAMPELVIDGTKVREVISNMVDNALKYTEKGGVTVRVKRGQFPVTGSLQHTNELRDAVRVIVSDTGIGVPKEELPYLFSKFSRGKDVARLNSGGTGLGLYVGKAMIEQNGGKIWAESDGEGMGSRFIVELPVAQDEELMKRWGNNS